MDGFGVGSGNVLNRVTIDVARPDDEIRRLVAEHLPIDAVCVNGRDWTPPPTIDPSAPPTLIPPEGSEDRLVGPEVRESADTVAIAVAVVPLEGVGFTCPGNPPLAVTVELEAPLGDRVLTDAAGNPPGPGF